MGFLLEETREVRGEGNVPHPPSPQMVTVMVSDIMEEGARLKVREGYWRRTGEEGINWTPERGPGLWRQG